MLVVGAEDSATRQVALHLAARGAALIVAGRDRHEVLVTAGLAAASGGTTRVVETPAPPLEGEALVDAATNVLARPTDALVCEGAATGFRMQELLGPSAFVVTVPSRPPGGARGFAQTTCADFEAFTAKGVSDGGPASDTLAPS